MWRLLRHPLATMRYAEEQLWLEQDRQYRGTVSPPIMLILTVALIQCVDLVVEGTSSIVSSQHGLAGLVNENSSLFFCASFFLADSRSFRPRARSSTARLI